MPGLSHLSDNPYFSVHIKGLARKFKPNYEIRSPSLQCWREAFSEYGAPTHETVQDFHLASVHGGCRMQHARPAEGRIPCRAPAGRLRQRQLVALRRCAEGQGAQSGHQGDPGVARSVRAAPARGGEGQQAGCGASRERAGGDHAGGPVVQPGPSEHAVAHHPGSHHQGRQAGGGRSQDRGAGPGARGCVRQGRPQSQAQPGACRCSGRYFPPQRPAT
ncbi:hypothetical protein FQZ97_920970 [compost metagenome]